MTLVRLAIAAGAAAVVAAPGYAAPSVGAEARPSRTSVGVPFTYVVEATLDSDEDAASARIVAPTGAFEEVAASELVRVGRTVTLTQRLACLSVACVPGDGGRVVELPAPHVIVSRGPASGDAAVVTVVPRVPAAAVAARTPVYRRHTALPAPALRGGPEALGAVFAGLALVFFLAAAAVVIAELRRRRRAEPLTQDDYARAVRLVRDSSQRSSADRRRAAGLLGRVARRRAVATVSGRADRVAWSRREPGPDDALELAADAESR